LITEDAAKLVVKQNTSGNGFETWRLFSNKFTLPGTTRDVGLLSQILSFSFSDTDFAKDFDRWEDLKKRYERDTKSSIPDSVLIALLVSKTKGPLLTHLRLNLAGLKTFQQLREEILQYHKTVHVLNQGTRGPAPMDVDALVNALQVGGPDELIAALHGKGYFKNRKGKGKGLGFSNFGTSSKGKGKGNFKGNFKGSKGKGKGYLGNTSSYKGNRPKGKGKGKKGKGKGFGHSNLGSTSNASSSNAMPNSVNALEAENNSATSGSEALMWGNTSSLDAEAWETSNTWYPEAWNEPLGSDWSQDGWVNHLSSDWDDSAWFDAWDTSEWTWDDNTSVVSYPSTAVNAVAQAPLNFQSRLLKFVSRLHRTILREQRL